MAYHRETTAGGFGGRAASSAGKPASQVKAGPFDLSPKRNDTTTTTMSDALITGLLIVYPVAATVVAVIVGLFLAGPMA